MVPAGGDGRSGGGGGTRRRRGGAHRGEEGAALLRGGSSCATGLPQLTATGGVAAKGQGAPGDGRGGGVVAAPNRTLNPGADRIREPGINCHRHRHRPTPHRRQACERLQPSSAASLSEPSAIWISSSMDPPPPPLLTPPPEGTSAVGIGKPNHPPLLSQSHPRRWST